MRYKRHCTCNSALFLLPIYHILVTELRVANMVLIQPTFQVGTCANIILVNDLLAWTE
jgi:hypothetical protein